MNEIDRIYKSARDVYSRKLRNATNQGTERHKAEKNLYQTWREAAIDLRDEARRGVVTTEELRKRLCYENREKLVKEWKDKESRRAELEFRAKTE